MGLRFERQGTKFSHRHRALRLLLSQFTSPIILILIGATALSMALGEVADAAIILAIVLASGLIGFRQEHHANRAIDALLQRIEVQVEVLRGGTVTSIPLTSVMVGDAVVLNAGDIVPADCVVVESKSLLIDESTLTGESFPVEKEPNGKSTLYFGTHVTSGSGTARVTATGDDTQFGSLIAELESRDVTTRFERGISAFGMLLVRAMALLVTVIFVANLMLDRPIVESMLFSLALAVGLTPQLLPAIVSVSLATGARQMAKERVIVKRLDAIEDFGTMTVLCTDKTGTLTIGGARLDAALDLRGYPSTDILRLARLNAGLQLGFPNPLDEAILTGAPRVDATQRLDEIPYDFARRRLSVLVSNEVPFLVTKGALRNVLEVSSHALIDGERTPIAEAREAVEALFSRLSTEGFRVLGVATREMPRRSNATLNDEMEMTLCGLLAFSDPPKVGVSEAIGELAHLGIQVKMITGDNHLAARHIAEAVGLNVDDVVTGSMISELDDGELAHRIVDVDVFAEVNPLDKERIVRALRALDETVGYLGDGINDSAALHAADVGISVDTAVDVAKQSAAVVLLDKSLVVVADGVRLGRRTFANTMKYVRVTTSANFGNMLSMAAASIVLPFLPLLPRQILLLNFLSDIPGTTIAVDEVDPEQLQQPRRWDIISIRRFMIVFGLVSSAFDILTFFTLRLVFDASTEVFRSGWFVESTATELAIMLVLRTHRPFFRSKLGKALLWTSVGVAVITLALPYSPLAEVLGLTHLPLQLILVLAGLTTVYIFVNEVVKRTVGCFQ